MLAVRKLRFDFFPSNLCPMRKRLLHLKKHFASRNGLPQVIQSFPRYFDSKKNRSTLLDNCLNYIGTWQIKLASEGSAKMKGSLSGEDESYVSLVKLTLSDEKIFRKFKSNRDYRKILEHVTYEQGAAYLKIIHRYKTANDKLLEFCTLNYCRPYRYTYPGIGKVSPTNLRYAKVALDLNSLFGDLSKFSIAEIGIGYGGQLQAILAQSGFIQYTFYDLDPVVELARKYLKNQNLKEFDLIATGANSYPNSYDLVVSNYAFSELDRETQESYLENVIVKSKRGYLIYNKITPEAYNSVSIKEFCDRVEGSFAVSEFPQTASGNQLVIWGAHNKDNLILK